MSILKTAPVFLSLVLYGGSAQVCAQEDPRLLMLQARTHQRRAGGDDPDTAAAMYQKAALLVPGSAEAQLRLSEALAEGGHLAEALAPAEKAVELDPKSIEAWAHLAILQYGKSQYEAKFKPLAVSSFQRATRLLPSDPELWFQLALACQNAKDKPGEMDAWLHLARLKTSLLFQEQSVTTLAWERTRELATALDRYEIRREAIMSLCQKPSPDPKHLRYLEELAKDQFDKGYLGHAEDSFALLGEHYADEPALWENIALIQLKTSRFDEALKSLRHAEQLRPSSRISYSIGICLMNLGRLQDVAPLWRELLQTKREPLDKGILQNIQVLLATTLLLQGRPADLLALLETWPEALAQADLLALKAQSHIQLQQWDLARKALREGLKRFPDHEQFQAAKAIPPDLFDEGLFFKKKSRQALTQLDLESMAILWSLFRQWDPCLEATRKALQAAPLRNVDILLLQASALEQLGRPEESIQVLRACQKLSPSHPTLQNNLGYLLLEKGGDLQEASRLIGAAMQQDPQSGSTMDSWGWVLFKQGRYQEAEQALRKAVDLSPYSPEIRKHLGEALLKLKRPEEALEQWERALAYAFPERKALEAQAQELRTTLAKQQKASEDPPREDSEAADDHSDEEP